MAEMKEMGLADLVHYFKLYRILNYSQDLKIGDLLARWNLGYRMLKKNGLKNPGLLGCIALLK